MPANNFPLRILSLIPHFGDRIGYSVPRWEQQTTRVDCIDRKWNQRSLIGQAVQLAQISSSYDRIVFFYNTRLPVLFWFINCVWSRKNCWEQLIFTTWLCGTALFEGSQGWNLKRISVPLRRAYYSLFARIFRAIVVHSSAEVNLYAETFGLPHSRLKFVPYFVRADALANRSPARSSAPPYVLAAGHHRDFSTYLAAVKALPVEAVLIGGVADRGLLHRGLPDHVHLLFEIPFQEYRQWIAQATVFVIPLLADRPRRSLGQIAAFEAIAARVPVVAARTFHLQDYFAPDEIFYYEPGDPEDLEAKIRQLLDNTSLRETATEKAYQSMVSKFTAQNYTDALLSICYE